MSRKKLFEEDGPIFMGAKRNKTNCTIGIFGVNYDGTTSFKPGARFGPDAIRKVSQSLETYCPHLNKDLDRINYCDFGSLKIDLDETKNIVKKVHLGTNHLLMNDLKPLVLGGEHSITTGVIKGLVQKFPNLIIIQLDAHADLRKKYLNNIHSHACTMQRCMEILPTKKILQLGIRSGTRNEFEEMHNNNQLVSFKTGNSCELFEKKLSQFKEFPIYLTIDLDWFDPSVLPGTGTPEPGGFFWHDFEKVIRVLQDYNIVGTDIVELSPDIDQSGISSVLAAKVARTLIMTLDKTFQKDLI